MAARTGRGVQRLAATWLSTARSLLPAPRERRVSDTDAGHARLWGRHHMAHVMVILTDTRQTLTTPTTVRPMTLAGLVEERQRAAETLEELGREVVADDTPAQLVPQVHRLLEEVSAVLTATPGPSATVESVVGPVRTTDHLRATLLDMVALALHDGIEVGQAALVEACRTAATILDETHGGRTIELRVPPACAVQLAASASGPSHHRGTPPNVAETDPATFLALATGLTDWSAVRSRGGVQASGSHVDDVADVLPVVDLAGIIENLGDD